MAKAWGALFDCNGVILDDHKLHYAVWNELSLELRGKPITQEEIFDHILSVPTLDGINWITNNQLSSDEVFALGEKRRQIEKQFIADGLTYNLVPGISQVFDWLRENMIPFTIVTSGREMAMRSFYADFDLDRWFDWDKIIYNDGMHNNKPAPDPYVLGAQKIGLSAKDCVVFEDSPNGIISGFAAGSRTIIGIARNRGPDTLNSLPGVIQTISEFSELDLSTIFITRKKQDNETMAKISK